MINNLIVQPRTITFIFKPSDIFFIDTINKRMHVKGILPTAFPYERNKTFRVERVKRIKFSYQLFNEDLLYLGVNLLNYIENNLNSDKEILVTGIITSDIEDIVNVSNVQQLDYSKSLFQIDDIAFWTFNHTLEENINNRTTTMVGTESYDNGILLSDDNFISIDELVLTEKFTISFWIKRNSSNSAIFLANTDGTYFFQARTNILYIKGQSLYIGYAYNLDHSKHNHITVVARGYGQYELYVNDVRVNNSTANLNIGNVKINMIGRNPIDGWGLNGSLRQLRISDTDRTRSQVTELYEEINPNEED